MALIGATTLRETRTPQIFMLPTNGSERDVRAHVTKRKISGGTRSDAFLGLASTCAKLGLAFWDYLGDRLAIPGQVAVPYLPELIRCRGQPA